MIFDNFLKSVEDGRKGLNAGIPMGFPRLDKFLRGLQRKKYYLCGAETGVGKTAFVDEAFILNPYQEIISKNRKESLKIFYYSFEIDVDSKLAKWVSYRLFMDLGLEVDPEHIMGMDMKDENDTKNRLSDELYATIQEYKEYFEKLFENIQFEDVPINPTGIKKQVEKYCEENGKWVEYERIIEGKPRKVKYYKPNNPNEYVLIIVDHVGLTKLEKQLNKKANIDKLDEYLIELRNKYRCSPVVISQFNRELGDIQRQKFKELRPQLTDFKDSGNTQESANVVIAIFHPKRYNLNEYLEYELKTGSYDILNNFRMAFILKNRGGRDGVHMAFRFLGICGYYEELPKPEDFRDNPKWYSLVTDFTKPFDELIKTNKK